MTAVADDILETRRISMDEFLALPDGIRSELVDGILIERKPMGALSDHVALRIGAKLLSFCDVSNAGVVFGSEATYRCFANPATGRRPDVSFIRRGVLPGDIIPDGAIDVPADIAVEVVSPHDLAYEVEVKVDLYLTHGFGEVWVAYPNLATVHIYRPGDSILLLQGDQILTGRGPLEGFACTVREFFPPQTAKSQVESAQP